MGASPLRKMVLVHETNPGGSYAPTSSYPRPPEGPSSRRRIPPGPPEVPGLQAQDHRPDPLVALAGRRRADHLAVRHLPSPRSRPLRRDGPQGPPGDPARLRRPATAAQRGAGRAPARDLAPPPPAPGHRPDADPVPRPAVPRPPGGLPQPGQGRHQPFPRLRHRLRHPQGGAVYRGLDRREERRGAQGRRPTTAPAGGVRGGPAPPAAARSRLLQRGGRS